MNNQKKFKKQLRLMTLTGMFMAIIYVLTAYLHVPTLKGYIHIGDGVIFLAACILPTPYAIVASSLGAALSDALSGYWIWVPATLIIKGLTAACFSCKTEKILCTRNLLPIIPAVILCVGGYGLYSGIFIYGSLVAGFADSVANLVQTTGSAIVFVLASIALDKSKIRKLAVADA